MGDTQQIDPANVQSPYPRPAGHPRIHLTPIAAAGCCLSWGHPPRAQRPQERVRRR